MAEAQPAAPWLGLFVAALALAPALWRTRSRPWGWLFLATLALALLLPALVSWPVPRPAADDANGGDRNWGGQLLALGATWVIARLLVRRAGLSWHEMGLRWIQAPGSLRVAMPVAALALAANLLLAATGPVEAAAVSRQTWLYQATLPGALEELLFRGVLLALVDRAYGARRQLAGVRVGWGAAVVTLVFVALHGLHPGSLLGVLPAAVLFLWLRLRTGSLLLPVLVHNLWNLSLLAGPLR